MLISSGHVTAQLLYVSSELHESKHFMQEKPLSVGVVVPTLNAATHWSTFREGLSHQALPVQRILIIDSCSSDGTADLARKAGFEVVSVTRSAFNHGGTRQVAANLMFDVDILVYLTQDAVLCGPESLANLIKPFMDDKVGGVYGRQLPRLGAGIWSLTLELLITRSCRLSATWLTGRKQGSRRFLLRTVLRRIGHHLYVMSADFHPMLLFRKKQLSLLGCF